MASISNFTKSGKRVSGTKRAGVKQANLGREIDGKVYQKPRLKAEQIDKGGAVVVTNPAASSNAGRNKRTAGLGMGAANTNMQRGRTRDF